MIVGESGVVDGVSATADGDLEAFNSDWMGKYRGQTGLGHNLRTTFGLAMSAMYKAEVPQYGNLVQLVQGVNNEILRVNKGKETLNPQMLNIGKERLDPERHGAIRLGSPKGMSTVRRIFRFIGLYPVGYYELSVAGLPMHATAFRPLS